GRGGRGRARLRGLDAAGQLRVGPGLRAALRRRPGRLRHLRAHPEGLLPLAARADRGPALRLSRLMSTVSGRLGGEAADGESAAAIPAAAGGPETTTGPRAVGRGWTTALALANLGLWLGYFGPLQVLMADQVQDIAPHDKSAMLGVVTGFGALVALVAGPVA